MLLILFSQSNLFYIYKKTLSLSACHTYIPALKDGALRVGLVKNLKEITMKKIIAIAMTSIISAAAFAQAPAVAPVAK